MLYTTALIFIFRTYSFHITRCINRTFPTTEIAPSHKRSTSQFTPLPFPEVLQVTPIGFVTLWGFVHSLGLIMDSMLLGGMDLSVFYHTHPIH